MIRPAVGRAGSAVTFLGIVVGTGPMVAQVKYVNWYHHKPTSWVIDDYNASDWERSAKAWRELQRRFGQPPALPPDAQGALDDAIVRKMEANPGAIQTPQGDYLIGRFGSLPAGRKDRVFAALVSAAVARTPAVAQSAQPRIDELAAKGLLAATHHDALADAALAEQSSRELSSGAAAQWLVDYLARRELEGALSPPRKERFLRHANDVLDLRVRPRIQVGTPLPVVYTTSAATPIPLMRHGSRTPGLVWWVSQEIKSVSVDGRQIMRGFGPSRSVGGIRQGSGRSSFGFDAPAGKHTLEMIFELGVYHGPSMDPAKSSLRGHRELTLKAQFETVAGPLPDVRWIDDASLEPAMRGAIAVSDANRKFGQNGLSVTLDVTNPPASYAADVIARPSSARGDAGHRLGGLAFRKGETARPMFFALQFPQTPDNKVDLILRPSARVAKESVDVMESWNGEIVYEGVVISR